MTLRDELVALLQEWNAAAAGSDTDDAALISSGRLDSSALFALSLWIEEKVGRPLDPATFAVARDWDSIGAILTFIRTARGEAAIRAAPAPAPAASAPAMALPPGVTLRGCTTSDQPAIAELQKRLWSSDTALNERFFLWRYAEAPAPAPPLIFLTLADGRIVGMRGAFASRWDAGAAGMQVWYQSDDLVILPEYRSRGIFHALAEALHRELRRQGHTHYLSTSTLRVTRMQSLADGARSLGSMQPVGRRTTPARILDAARDFAARLPMLWRLGDRFLPAERADAAFRRLDATPESRHGKRILRVLAEARADDMAGLISRLPHDGRIRQVRSAAFLAWRYRNPLHDYRFVYCDEEGRLSGYAVFERSRSDLANARRINLADWDGESPAVLAALLEFALRGLRPAELVSWTACVDQAQLGLLQALGFGPVDREQVARGMPGALVWPLAPDGDARLFKLENWDLRMSDTSLA